MTTPNATVRAIDERSDTTACQRGMGAVSPRRCISVLVRKAAAAITPAITAAGIARASVPVSGRAAGPRSRMPAIVPTTKQITVAQTAVVSPRSLAS